MLFHIEKLAEKLAHAQLKNPVLFLVICAVLTIGAGIYASGIKFDSSYEALLPIGAKELANIDAVRKQTGGTRQLVIAIKGKSPSKRIEFAKKIAPKLEQLNHVRCVDLEFPVDFFRDRALWMADISTLDKLIPAVKNAVNIAKSQANPLALHLDEEAEQKELENAWKKVEKITKTEKTLPFDKILHSKDNRYTFLLLVPTIKFTDMELARSLIENIKTTVDNAEPENHHVSVEYAGALEVLSEQHVIMGKDMVSASVLAAIFGILIVVGFTRKIMAPVVVVAALSAGIVWTFAMARLYVGHVNIITGFLAAVLIGLGIDFSIHLFVRYLQEMQNEKQSKEQAFVNFIKGTASPAVTAALTTAGVFFSFAVAKFRGFSEFGLIAGTGVMFTLVSSFLVLPPLLLIVYRRQNPGDGTQKKSASPKPKGRISFTIATTTVLVMVGFAIFGATNISNIPFKNDFRELRGYSDATEFFDYVNKNLGAGFNPAVFVADSIADVSKIESALLAEKAASQNAHPSSQIGNILSINNVLPQNVEAHAHRIKQLYDILWSSTLDKAAAKQTPQGKKLRTARKMVKTQPWNQDDIPEIFKRRFLTVDEINPRYIVYTWSKGPHDADYRAAQWESRLESVSAQLNDAGVAHDKADETLIISWVYRVVKADGAPLLVVAAAVVLLFLILDFRTPKDVMLLVIPLAVGMLVFVAMLKLLNIDFNMFNMVVIPSVIGIGIDNAVHILHRYKKEGAGSVLFVLKNTGAAALLASVTTAVGFGASIIAHNRGLQSLGYTAMLGIGVTFIAAVFLLPCILSLLELSGKNSKS